MHTQTQSSRLARFAVAIVIGGIVTVLLTIQVYVVTGRQLMPIVYSLAEPGWGQPSVTGRTILAATWPIILTLAVAANGAALVGGLLARWRGVTGLPGALGVWSAAFATVLVVAVLTGAEFQSIRDFAQTLTQLALACAVLWLPGFVVGMSLPIGARD